MGASDAGLGGVVRVLQVFPTPAALVALRKEETERPVQGVLGSPRASPAGRWEPCCMN